MRCQGELQRHQAAAHRTVTGPDEEAEEHSGGGLLHVIPEAPAQVTVDILIVAGRDCRTYCEQRRGHRLTSILLVNIFTSVFTQKALSVNILLVRAICLTCTDDLELSVTYQVGTFN